MVVSCQCLIKQWLLCQGKHTCLIYSLPSFLCKALVNPFVLCQLEVERLSPDARTHTSAELLVLRDVTHALCLLAKDRVQSL